MKKKRGNYGKLRFGTRQEGYTYFYTKEQWEKARESLAFLRWANGNDYSPDASQIFTSRKGTVKVKPKPKRIKKSTKRTQSSHNRRPLKRKRVRGK